MRPHETRVPVRAPTARPHHPWWLRAWVLVLLLCGLLTIAGAAAAWQLLLHTGRTPTEFLDHLDQKLDRHPTLLRLFNPMLAGLRSVLAAPSVQERDRAGFDIPEPPPRRGAQDVAPAAPAPGTKVWKVGPKENLIRIADAARLAGDGDIVEIEAGDYHGDTAVWEQERLTIRGIHGAARLYAAGRAAEDKAIWIFRHGHFEVANVDFIGAKAKDGNGAGIRLEKGHLRLVNCLFWGNQMGLVTANLPHATDTTLEVHHSEFAYSHTMQDLGHNLYVGAIDRVTVVSSYFHHASRGHLIKSRAKVSDIAYSRLTDESGGRSAYEMNFPNGGQVRLLGNVVQQQDGTENGVMVAYGEEGYRWPRNTLTLASNTLVNDLSLGGAFLRVAPGAERVDTSNNLLVGFGRYLITDPLVTRNDQRAEWDDLALPARHDYRLRNAAPRFLFEGAADPALRPRQQYLHPRKTLALPQEPHVVGADQQALD